MKNKKIAFFLQNLSGGGAEKSVVNLSNYLVNDGVDIDIVLVNKYEVGRCISTIDPFEIARQIVSMVDTMDSGNIRDRCEALVREQFSSRNAAIQILKSFDAWRN